ncbi:hypothetical protein HYFRA_00012272 [Hymenoscyphus fraxineus]|uniref:Glycoside hydrolase family 31 protein n=1 Tax=Hymenoscyphus fraxineus TaxID=746836 RepID=A0A9N9L201_9HELO|nr:hypothetical protein HYFRA_00012272 [Hymenoscyphus fraxineus]
MFLAEPNKLIFRFDNQILWVEAWGENALRVRATKQGQMPTEAWALSEKLPDHQSVSVNLQNGKESSITNGKIKAIITPRGKLTIYNSQGTILLEEYARNRVDPTEVKTSALEIEAREFKAILGNDWHLTARFEPQDPDERIYGMGQYQQPFLNLKGTDIELAQRNSQASVPFAVSSRGYGFLWNNPGIGRAVLGKNIMSFEAYSTKIMDYWVVAGDKPSEIVETYSSVTGRVPMMPEYGLGFWQCKLRYETQDELLSVAREYRKRKIPIDLIVIDFFHWKHQGDWDFDLGFWPDPDAMIKELKDLKIELMVSVWPTVAVESPNHAHMLVHGLLVQNDRGYRKVMPNDEEVTFFDATNPSARDFVWTQIKKNYYDKGIKVFWLDEAEPEYNPYDFDVYRYHAGPNLQVGNSYPKEYARGFYEGMEKEGQKNIVNLLRCAWAGSQKYGALVWSGDIGSSWVSFRNQIAAGLNMGMSGICWWTTDIGGFHGGNPDDPEFRELFTRWFQWGAFLPVMRLHGDREPKLRGPTGSGGHNEVWSYGEEVLKICTKYIELREQMRDYTRGLMKEAHEKGTPIIRPMFYEFPDDHKAWEVETQYMYGDKYLVVPILAPKQRKITAYLPQGAKWRQEGNDYEGGQAVEVDCPLDYMPVFERL